MGRHRKPTTAQEKIRAPPVIAWARRAGFYTSPASCRTRCYFCRQMKH